MQTIFFLYQIISVTMPCLYMIFFCSKNLHHLFSRPRGSSSERIAAAALIRNLDRFERGDPSGGGKWMRSIYLGEIRSCFQFGETPLVLTSFRIRARRRDSLVRFRIPGIQSGPRKMADSFALHASICMAPEDDSRRINHRTNSSLKQLFKVIIMESDSIRSKLCTVTAPKKYI